MTETRLITNFDVIDHRYGDEKIYFNLLLSVTAKKLEAGEQLTWGMLLPWKWTKFQITIGCMMDNGTHLEELAPVNPLQSGLADDAEAIKIQDAVFNRCKVIYGNELKDINNSKGLPKSSITGDVGRLQPTDPNETKHIQEFLINEANRPVPIGEKLNLNFCFSIEETKLIEFLNTNYPTEGDNKIDRSKLRIFAFPNFVVDQNLFGEEDSREFPVTGLAKLRAANGKEPTDLIEVAYKTEVPNHGFIGVSNTVALAEVLTDAPEPMWLKVDVDYDDWLVGLKRNLAKSADALELHLDFADFLLSQKTNLTKTFVKQWIASVHVLLGNRMVFTASDTIYATYLCGKEGRLSTSEQSEAKKLYELLRGYETNHKLYLNEHVDNGRDNVNTIAKNISDKAAAVGITFPKIDTQDSEPENLSNIFSAALSTFRQIQKNLPDGEDTARLLKQIFDSATANEKITLAQTAPLASRLVKADFCQSRRMELIKQLITEFEKERADINQVETISKKLEKASLKHFDEIFKATALDLTQVDAEFQTFKAEFASRIKALAPDTEQKSMIPRKDVQPVSFNVKQLTNADTVSLNRITGLAFCLTEVTKEDSKGNVIETKDWSCLNTAAISIGDNKSPIVDRTLVPTKVSKVGGLLQSTVIYNNAPLCTKSLFAKLLKAVSGQVFNNQATTYNDIFSYTHAKIEDLYEQIPMLKYGSRYLVACSIVDRGGAAAVELVGKEPKHPGVLLHSSAFEKKLPYSNFIYQRHVGVGTPRILNSLPKLNEDIAYISNEVVSNQIPIISVGNSPVIFTARKFSDDVFDELRFQKIHATNCHQSPILEIKLTEIQNNSSKNAGSFIIDLTKGTLSTNTVNQPVAVPKPTTPNLPTPAPHQPQALFGPNNDTNQFDSIKLVRKNGTITLTAYKKDGTSTTSSLNCSSKPEGLSVTLSASYQSGDVHDDKSGVISFEDATSVSKLHEEEIFPDSHAQLVFLYPELWKGTVEKPNTINLTIKPPTTSFDNWERWYCSDSPSKDFHASVIKEYLNHLEIAQSEQDSPFSMEDPACDKIGYLELTKVFPLREDNNNHYLKTWFSYDATTIGDAKKLCTITTDPAFASAKIKVIGQNISINLPEGEVWEIKIHGCVSEDEFGANERCHPLLKYASSTNGRVEIHQVKNKATPYVLFSPLVLRIETACKPKQLRTASPDKRAVFLEKLKGAIETVPVGSADKQVEYDYNSIRASFNPTIFSDADEIHLYSKLSLHRQSWRWDGQLLSTYPNDEESKEGLESSIQAWEAREFSNFSKSVYKTNHANLKIGSKSVLLFERDLTKDTKADLHRFAITVESRYAPLHEDKLLSTLELSRFQKSPWRRQFIKCKWREKVPAPLIKMVLPLTNTFASNEYTDSHSRTNPDLLVILSEPPFGLGGLAERIVPEICQVEVPPPPKAESASLVAKSVPSKQMLQEFGPDPVLLTKYTKPALISKGFGWDPKDGDVGRRVGGLTVDIGSDYPRFSSGALVLKAPTNLDYPGDAIDLAWYMAKLQFRRVFDKSTTVPHNLQPDPIYDGYSSEPTTPIWTQILPDSNVNRDLIQNGLKFDGKIFKDAQESSRELTIENVGWQYSNKLVEQKFFSYCALVTETVLEADGGRVAEKYITVLRWDKLDKPTLAVAGDVSLDLSRTLKSIPQNGMIRLLEIQTEQETTLSTLLTKPPAMSLWDALFLPQARNEKFKEDAKARITRISQPIKFSRS